MRIRTVKPEWLDDEALVLASSEARVLSIALILLADDYGNGRANYVVMSGRVFPGKAPETLANALLDLERCRFVRLYEVDGQRYFSIRNWDKHQKVDKPGKPQVPAFIEPTTTTEKPPEALAKVPETLATDQDQEGTRKGPGAYPRARVCEVPPKSPTALRSEVLRLGYLERFERACPDISPPGQAQPMGGGPWLDLARETTDADASRLLDAFFTDDFARRSGFKLGVLVSERVRLLTQGAGQKRGQAPPATAKDFERYRDPVTGEQIDVTI